jgi:hypothetical protein
MNQTIGPSLEAPPASNWRAGYLPVILAGLGVAAVGLTMPWVTAHPLLFGRLSFSGLDTDAGKIIAVVIAAVALVACEEARASRPLTRAALAAGTLLAGAILGFECQRISGEFARLNEIPGGTVRIAHGFFVVGAGLSAAAFGAARRITGP